jgi:type 1 glutamine amidotransferase
MKRILLILTVLSIVNSPLIAGLKAIKLTDEWKAKIKEKAPAMPTVIPAKKHKVLLFSLMTGYKHWVTPHTAEVVKIMGKKTGVYEVVESNDVKMFTAESLAKFDGVILNNTCSKGPGRNMFIDVLGKGKKDEAAKLEANLIDFVAKGKGLIALHGAIVILNSSEKFGEVLGGAFDFHPKQQEVVATPVDPDHPLVKAFEGKPFIHVDEPYLFKGAYKKKNFRPLMVMDTSKLDCGKKTEAVRADVRYIAWIKSHEKGRVFYCSPSHNAQSFEDPRLLKFMLDGFQYALGDLKCDDTPLKKK